MRRCLMQQTEVEPALGGDWVTSDRDSCRLGSGAGAAERESVHNGISTGKNKCEVLIIVT